MSRINFIEAHFIEALARDLYARIVTNEESMRTAGRDLFAVRRGDRATDAETTPYPTPAEVQDSVAKWALESAHSFYSVFDEFLKAHPELDE